jgi:type II secretory pathway component GspD/PulD (secretin)
MRGIRGSLAMQMPPGAMPPGVHPGQPPQGEQPGQPGQPQPGQPQPGQPDPNKPAEPAAATRPTTPPEPANAKELEVRPDANGKLTFNFKGQPWPAVLDWLAEVSHMSLDWQEAPGDYLNLTTQRPYTVAEARDAINTYLLIRGFTLLENGETLSVVNIKKLDPSMVPRVDPKELAARQPHEFVKVSFPLDWLIAESTVDEIKPMLSPNAKVTPLRATNRLEVMDAVINLREVRKLLEDEQTGGGQERLVRTFTLKHTKAEEVVNQLKGLLGMDTGAKSGPVSPEQMQQQMQMQQMQMQQMQQQQQQGGGMPKPKAEVYLVVNSRENSILVNSPPDKLAIIAQAIEAIDIPRSSGEVPWGRVTRMKVYRLAGLDPESLLKLLEETGGFDPSTRLQVDKTNKALIAYAPQADHLLIQAMVDKLDGSGRKFTVLQLRRLEADYVAGSIEFMMGNEKKDDSQNRRRSYYFYDPFGQQDQGDDKTDKFRVEADVEFRRLLLWANEVEMNEVRNLLAQLGEIPVEGGNPERVRVVPVNPGGDMNDLMDRIREGWIGPNRIEFGTGAEQPAEDAAPATPDSAKQPAGTPVREAAKPRQASSRNARAQIVLAAAEQAEPAPAAREDDPSDADATDAADEADAEERARKILEKFERSLPPNAGAVEQSNSPAEPRPADKQDSAPAPIRITHGPKGLVITSDDTQALDQLQELIDQVQPQRDDFKIFHLKYAYASSVKLNLKDIFEEEDKDSRRPWWWDDYGDDNKDEKKGRLSKRRQLKFISDFDTNTIMVKNADPVQLAKIEEIIKFYDRPEPSDSQSIRRMKHVRLNHAKAQQVAEVLKEVYRDLLSSNDKALQNGNQQQEQRPERGFILFPSSDGDTGNDTKLPKFKGLLSIGIDAPSNSLVISAPEYLMRSVDEVVQSLDDAARPSNVVKVVKLQDSLKGTKTREALARAIGAAKAASNSAQQQGQEGGEGGENGGGRGRRGPGGQPGGEGGQGNQ